MKKKIMQFVALLLSIVFLFPTSHMIDNDDKICVGLAYGSSALTAANLLNNTNFGEGYRFGYFDRNMNFVELGKTSSSVEAITMVKATDIYLYYSNIDSAYVYSEKKPDRSHEFIGCYHVTVGTYANYADASYAASNYSNAFVAWIEGTYQVRIGAYATRGEAEAVLLTLHSGGMISWTSAYAINVVETGTTDIIFQFDGGVGTSLAVMPDVTGARDVRTWFKGYRYQGGFQYMRVNGGDITVTNVIGLEEYVKGVIPYEMSTSWPLEALKAQAVCARTYAAIKVNASTHASSGFDICNTTHCQVYHGIGSANDVTNRAVDETAGDYLWYNGKMAETYYSSSHGGASESAYNVWGSSMSQYPYLSGVIDPYEELISNKNANSSWTASFTRSQLNSIFGKSVSSMTAVYSDKGNVISLTIQFENGTKTTLKPDQIRSTLSLKSIRFTINGMTPTGSVEIPTSSNGISVNGNQSISDLNGVYIIDGDGGISAANAGEIYVISGSGTIARPDTGGKQVPTVSGGSVTVSGNTYTMTGSGWGHNLGMSQYGAYAMADVLGYSYDEILEFYFPGTYVSDRG